MTSIFSNCRIGGLPLIRGTILLVFLPIILPLPAVAQSLIGEEPALGSLESRTTQAEIQGLGLSFLDIRLAGFKMFATQFRKADGWGDGPLNPSDTINPGGRPTLQNNGTFLRVNGLDSQSCLDCHSVVSTDAVPIVSGIGGSGGLNNSAMFMTRSIDVADIGGNGFADFNGRVINPPALFGTGGVQLAAKEMTAELQILKNKAIERPGKVIRLVSKDIRFGSVVADKFGTLDTSNVEGIDPDLVVRPFGRKGEFASVRQFDLGALMFHLGMQPVEVVGSDIDADGDGVSNEVMVGEVSALEIFVTSQETPVALPMGAEETKGFKLFKVIGCTGCHRPALETNTELLSYSFPEEVGLENQNSFYSIDLNKVPTAFESGKKGGIIVRMFSDLKRHDMGPGLAENFHAANPAQNREFITAKLWGVADTAPYLHDGRALTLNKAILLHGGDAQSVRDTYSSLADTKKNQILAFLRTLRNPVSPNQDVLF